MVANACRFAPHHTISHHIAPHHTTPHRFTSSSHNALALLTHLQELFPEASVETLLNTIALKTHLALLITCLPTLLYKAAYMAAVQNEQVPDKSKYLRGDHGKNVSSEELVPQSRVYAVFEKWTTTAASIMLAGKLCDAEE